MSIDGQLNDQKRIDQKGNGWRGRQDKRMDTQRRSKEKMDTEGQTQDEEEREKRGRGRNTIEEEEEDVEG